MDVTMMNTVSRNDGCAHLVSSISRWHHLRNLIDGATDKSQSKKLLEEFTELVAAIHPDASPEFIYDEIVSMLDDLLAGGRIKSVKAEDSKSALVDAIGDMTVVQINILERNKETFAGSMRCAYNEIKDRKGRMIDGVFVKEADL